MNIRVHEDLRYFVYIFLIAHRLQINFFVFAFYFLKVNVLTMIVLNSMETFDLRAHYQKNLKPFIFIVILRFVKFETKLLILVKKHKKC